MHVLHANWSRRQLHVWAEDASRHAWAGARGQEGSAGVERETDGRVAHPSAAGADVLRGALASIGVTGGATASVDVLLPCVEAVDAERTGGGRSAASVPLPSTGAAHAAGQTLAEDVAVPTGVAPFGVPSIAFAPSEVPALFEALAEAGLIEGRHSSGHTLGAADSVRFFALAARFARHLMAHQRIVPSLLQDMGGSLRAAWQPWIGDEPGAARFAALVAAMPPSARAAIDGLNHDGDAVLDEFLFAVTDAACRAALTSENMQEAIESRDPTKDDHVAWLSGLLDGRDGVPLTIGRRSEVIRRARQWISTLEDRGPSSAWRLLLRLGEPIDLPAAPGARVGAGKAPTRGPEPTDAVWPLTFHLQSAEDHAVVADASDLWLLPGDAAQVQGKRIDSPQELLLAELGRAVRLYKPLESALSEPQPESIELSTAKAYEFLREVRPLLIEQGFGVEAPEWWESPNARLGVRLLIDSDPLPLESQAGPGSSSAAPSRLGLDSLVNYRWQIALGDVTLTLAQFEELAARNVPLIKVAGKWVEVRPEDVHAAVEFIREHPGGRMDVGQAVRLAFGADGRDAGLPIVGLEATGWVSSLFGGAAAGEKIPMLEAPSGFVGTLRPYQLKGLSWLAFLDRFGLGACLADDMGLGKTIQLLALLLHERAEAARTGAPAVCPTLLVVPMSVVGNWVRESQRFAPELRTLVHHGPERMSGDALLAAASASDLVVTTYALVHRDRESLGRIGWGRIALDEAQNIKNPAAKQAQAVRALNAPRRVALTGTPIENRLSELWSIMDFLNTGFLGSATDFRRRLAVPIERYHDQNRSRQLRSMVQPFILRRLKSDPSVVADLPSKVESKEFCYLTAEQAALYEACVKRMLGEAERSEGIQRRGVILAGLIKLKQVCNHPSQYLKDHLPGEGASGGTLAPVFPDPARSGKVTRLIEMLDEILAAGGQALVFTQFRQMGHILAPILRRELDREVLFLHGGTPAKEREALIASFQKQDGSAPIFILSLKAGGVGLNLTGANHVFHFDRWWNPAVEAQATDRAYRIGQTRTVQVHKFVVGGTLEERIDQMIEQKTVLADNVIGSGEQWLTELSLGQLRDMLLLRSGAVEEVA
ncbi:MAG: DEAD/DEAH box helicase [Phycisphaerae bacterium]|nr:DEAD/DEAH box helicase [Phycisphaerae bacterium]